MVEERRRRRFAVSLVVTSVDRRFRVEVSDAALAAMIQTAREAAPKETGGILIGRYSGDLRTALVEMATEPTLDSKSARARFYRGVQGLEELLSRLWRRPGGMRWYYLGEWHSHAERDPVPSPRDVAEMQRIAESERYRCPEPVLVLLGGRPPDRGSLTAWVFPRGRPPLRLESGE